MEIEEFAEKCGVVFVQLPKASANNDTSCYDGRWGYHLGDKYTAEYGYRTKKSAAKGWFDDRYSIREARTIKSLLEK